VKSKVQRSARVAPPPVPPVPAPGELAPATGAAPTGASGAASGPASLAPGATASGDVTGGGAASGEVPCGEAASGVVRGGGSATRVAVAYESPLVVFRGYRAGGQHVLQPDCSPRPRHGQGAQQRPISKAQAASDHCTGIFAHHIEWRRALCPFDLRGLCHDPRCPWQSRDDYTLNGAQRAGAYTRSLFSSTSAVLVTPLCDPLSNRVGGNHALNVSNNVCSR
jgi:hypothetical protein